MARERVRVTGMREKRGRWREVARRNKRRRHEARLSGATSTTSKRSSSSTGATSPSTSLVRKPNRLHGFEWLHMLKDVFIFIVLPANGPEPYRRAPHLHATRPLDVYTSGLLSCLPRDESFCCEHIGSMHTQAMRTYPWWGVG